MVITYLHSVIKHLLKAYYKSGSMFEGANTRHSIQRKRYIDKKGEMKLCNGYRGVYRVVYGGTHTKHKKTP